MRKLRSALLVLLVILVLGLGVWLGLIAPKVIGFRASPVVYNTATMLREVQTLSELVTVKYVLEKVVVLEDPPKSLLGQMFAGENRVLLVAHGIVKAGVDLGALKPADVRIGPKKITVSLPRAQITDVYLDDTQTQIVERKTGLLRRVDKDLEQNARRIAIDDLQRAARHGGILDDAAKRARLQLTALFKQMGFEQVEIRAP